VADDLSIIADLADEQLSERARAAIAELADRNALLRASLSEMRARIFELEQLADSDTLTPLPNRRRFLKELERVTTYAKRHNTPAAVLYVDLDNLKAINDAHGHFAGDAGLIHVARLLQGLIRSTDVAARIGGDEFALILDHLDHDSAIDTAERIARCVADNPLDLGSAQVRIEASIGTATILPGDTVEDVLQRADRNVALAKTDG
jgi:diguanylate cyclase (GGDEF)-like protein